VSYLCVNTSVFFEKHVQNLNTPQNNSASWELQMGLKRAFRGLRWNRIVCWLESNLTATGSTPVKTKTVPSRVHQSAEE